MIEEDELQEIIAEAEAYPKCRSGLDHARPCGPVDREEDCSCGCDLFFGWCMEEIVDDPFDTTSWVITGGPSGVSP